jgi:translation initiation factor IF-3
MPPYHISSIPRALYRVFVAPNLNVSRTLLSNVVFKPLLRRPVLPQVSIRTKMYKKNTQRHALTDSYTLDNAITSPRINFIDLNGVYHQDIPTVDAQSSLNRTTHHLMLVSPGRVDEFGRPSLNASHLPVCKAISKIELRTQHQKKLDIARRKSKGIGSGPSPKSLELNWAIASGDLKHRLEKMKEFLREGRKVEVLLGPKRRGRVATEKECQVVLQAVKDAVAECKGAGQAKEPEGRIGGVLTLVYEGRRIEKEMGERAVAD